MKTFKSLLLVKTLTILLAAFSGSYTGMAQSSLFNIPTTDVMSSGETYVEADFDAHLTDYRRGGFQSYGGALVYGARNRTEIGVNAYFMKTGEGFQPLEFQPNAKWQIFNDEKSGTAVSTGAILYVPATRRAFRDTIGSIYVTASKQFRGSYSPRFTAGTYTLVGRKEMAGGRNGFLFGFEQPLHRRLYFIADWNSGKNRFGYSAVGLGVTLTKRSNLYTAYYFGNQGRGNNSLGIYYGYSF